MNRIFKEKNLPLIVALAGIIGWGLQLWLLSTADEKGFVTFGHISQILLLLLTVAVLGGILWLTRNLQEAAKYHFNFPPSSLGFGGLLVGALGFFVDSMTRFAQRPEATGMFIALLGLACTLCIVYLAACRRDGLRPNSLFYVFLCFYLALRLIGMYRFWSGDPQVEDYAFPLLATAFLMLTCYYRAMFNAGMGKRRLYMIFNLMTLYFCLLSLTELENVAFYLGCGAWMMMEPCNLTPLLPVKPEQEEPEQEEPFPEFTEEELAFLDLPEDL